MASKNNWLNWKNAALVAIALIALAEFAALWFLVISPRLEASKPLKVLIVGKPSDYLLDLFASEDYKLSGISLDKVVSDSQVTEETLSQVDLVIMRGEEYCDNSLAAYSTLERKKFSASGKRSSPEVYPNLKLIKLPKFVLIGNACSLSKNSRLVGWTALHYEKAGESLAPEVALSSAPLKQEFFDGKFLVEVNDHPIFFGIANSGFYGSTFVFDKAVKQSVLASIVNGSPSTEQVFQRDYESVPAIVKIGDDLYYSFDAGNAELSSRNLFLNSLLYLAGKLPY